MSAKAPGAVPSSWQRGPATPEPAPSVALIAAWTAPVYQPLAGVAGRVIVVVGGVPSTRTLIVKAALAAPTPPSGAWPVNVSDPDAVGVPERTPPGASDSPGGSAVGRLENAPAGVP